MVRVLDHRGASSARPKSQLSVLRSRGLLLALVVCGSVGGAVTYSGPSWAIVVFQLLVAIPLLVAWLLSSVSIGWPLARRLAPQEANSLLKLATSAALG